MLKLLLPLNDLSELINVNPISPAITFKVLVLHSDKGYSSHYSRRKPKPVRFRRYDEGQ